MTDLSGQPTLMLAIFHGDSLTFDPLEVLQNHHFLTVKQLNPWLGFSTQPGQSTRGRPAPLVDHRPSWQVSFAVAGAAGRKPGRSDAEGRATTGHFCGFEDGGVVFVGPSMVAGYGRKSTCNLKWIEN